jgi:hypothetical protein
LQRPRRIVSPNAGIPSACRIFFAVLADGRGRVSGTLTARTSTELKVLDDLAQTSSRTFLLRRSKFEPSVYAG